MHHNHYSRYVAPSPARSRIETHSMHNYAEAENVLELERKLFRQTKEKLENEVDAERARRIEIETKVVRVKEEISQRDRYITDIEFKINNLHNEIEDYRVENERLRNEVKRHSDIYSDRIKQLQKEIRQKDEQYDSLTKNYSEQFEQFRKQGMSYVEELTREHERNLKSLTERVKTMEAQRRDRQFSIKQLNEENVNIRCEYEDKLRELSEAFKNEEIRRGAQKAKGFEAKIRSLEEKGETLQRRNVELQKQLSSKCDQLDEKENENRSIVQRFQQQLGNDSTKMNSLSIENTRLKNDLQSIKMQILDRTQGDKRENQSIIARLKMERDGIAHELKEDRTRHDREVEQLKANIGQLKASIQNQSWEKNKAIDNYSRLCQAIKHNVNDTIAKQKKRPI